MGVIGRVLDIVIDRFIRLVFETRFSFNQRGNLFGPSGDDSPPLPDDRLLVVRIDKSGKFCGCSVLSVSAGAAPGEKILFSRDSGGSIKAKIHLTGDGNIVLQDGGKAAARKDDSIESGMADDSIFWTWISAAGSALSSLGVAAPIPSSLTGKITSGSESVEIGD